MVEFFIQSKVYGLVRFIVDDVDASWVKQYRWFVQGNNKHSGTLYIGRKYREPNGKRINVPLHRDLLGVKDPGIFVDHENGDGLDNRRENLRIATNQQNQFNRGKMHKNVSGYKGIYFNKHAQKFEAGIKIDGKRHYLGTFNTAEEASAAYTKAAKIAHGEFYNEESK